MRIALGLPSRIVGASGELMLEWATRADRGPFSSLVVTDRVVSQALEPQPGMKVVYARTTIDSDRDQVKKLYIGYSDDVSVFVNGDLVYSGINGWDSRSPAFASFVDARWESVSLPFKAGENEVVLVTRHGERVVPKASKPEIAVAILDAVEELLQ